MENDFLVAWGPVQTPLHSCAEPKWWIKYRKRAASESIWYGIVWCGRVCRTFVELNLGSTHGTPSESDVAPVSLQSRTYSVRFGTWKVRRLNQAWENSRYLATLLLVSPPNDVWETSAEIPYWWRVTQIWVVTPNVAKCRLFSQARFSGNYI